MNTKGLGRRLLSFRAFAIAILALNAIGLYWIRSEVRAGSSTGVWVERVSPTESAEKADELSLVFSRAVAALDKVGEPLAESPFQLEPRQEGHWRWRRPDRLCFVLREKLPRGHVFTLSATPRFEALTGLALEGQERFELRTTPLQVRSVRVEGVEGELATLAFRFDQRVAPADLLEHLEVHGIPRTGTVPEPGEAPLEVTAHGTRASERLSALVRRGDEPCLQVTLRPGLAGDQAERGLERTGFWDLELPDRFSVLSADARASSRENRCTVVIRFSERLAHEQELPPLEFDPPVEGVERHVSGRSIVAEGPFECGRSYRVRVGPTILSRHGKTLGQGRELTFEIPAREPALFFPLDRGILSPEGNLELAMCVTNLTGIELAASRVHENNLVAYLNGSDKRYTSRDLGKKKIALELPPNQVHTTLIDLDTFLASPVGIYRIEARATDEYWTRDWSLVRITDISLNVKRERHGLLVWATSLRDATPMAGVVVEARTSNNQILGGALSDEDGLARLLLPDDHPDGDVYVVTARNGLDSTFLTPGRRSWVFDGVNTSGRPPDLELDCLFYAERGVYRPGDEVHLTGILRDGEGGIPTGELPLNFTVTRPDGQEIVRTALEGPIDAQGLFHVDFETDPLGQTGGYRFAVTRAGESREVGGTTALVEAFVPARIEVGAEVTEAEDAALAIEVDARYLFGRPAAGLPVTVLPYWRRVDFTSKAYPGFRFDEEHPHPSRGGDRVEASLDEEGHARLLVAAPEGRSPGLWRASLNATVTEPGSRSVSRRATGEWDAAARHLGLRCAAGQSVEVGATFDLEWMLVAPDDTAAPPAETRIELIRLEYGYRKERVNGRMVWRSEETELVIDRREPGLAASGRLQLSCPEWGRYRVVGTDLETGVETHLDLYTRSRGGLAFHEMGGEGPESLTLELEAASYVPGETAIVRVGGSFAGTLLLTLETDEVLESRVLPFEGGAAEVEILVPEGLRGGAFVCGSLIRAIDPTESTWLPHRARGLVRLDTDHTAHRAPIELEVPEHARPGEAIAVTVQGEPRADGALAARLHLWAVDEGILQATEHSVPDPHAHFFARRRAGVSTADGYGDLLPDHRQPATLARIGGDEDTRAERRRRGPQPTKRREAAVVWRKAVELGYDGRAEVPLEMPQLRGAMRLMVVVVDGDRYGSAEQRIELSTPIVVAASTPRFLTSNDRFKIPVRVTNTTADVKHLDLDAVVEGSLELTAPEGLTGIELAPGGEEVLWFGARATVLGPIDLRFTARGEGILEVESQHVDVVPSAPLHQSSQLVTLRGGERAMFDPTEELHIDGLDARLEISAAPAVELRPALQALLRYPYGCVEQTTSRLFAIVHAGPLLGDDSGEGGTSPVARDMVEAGLGRLRTMQTRSGGLAYWPYGKHPNLWGTAYAASFLVEARRGGYELERGFIEPLLDYLSEELREGNSGPDEKALFCRVLAAFDRPHQGWNARLSEELEKLDTCGRANLAGAWLESGRRDRALECLPEGTIERVARPATSGRITSGVRQKGALLAVLLDLDHDHPWIDALVAGLMAERENGRWRNTLENSTALCALARYQLVQAPPGDFRGRVRLPDGEVLEFDSSAPAVFRLDEPDGPLEIELEGDGPAHVLLDCEGFALEELEPYDEGLVVRRRWLSPEGADLAGETLNVGDLVIVEVSVKAPELDRRERVRNLAVVDPLPPGLEVENPRLASSASVPGPSSGRADRVEFLDDRVLIFTGASRDEERYRYALRASAVGTFTIPPIQASSMYDPGFASLGETGTVRIEE